MTSLARFRKRLNKELSEQTIPDEIETAEDPIDIPEVVADEPQDDLPEELVESADVVLIPYEEAADEIVEEVIEPSDPVEFVVDPAILEEPKKEELVSIEQHLKNIDGMLKQELDDYALNYGIELDRRQTKPNMVNEFITKLKEKN
jgi:hypothetical protein